MEKVDFFVIQKHHKPKDIADYITFGLQSRGLPLQNFLFIREDLEYIYVYFITNI